MKTQNSDLYKQQKIESFAAANQVERHKLQRMSWRQGAEWLLVAITTESKSVSLWLRYRN
ncbi:conserved hypothetical protein [Ricinus communis]|uniref:Uncharacterized protein n=1 Tax=Ricinus communis TaxID=3988 RepID=B9RB29_RICCO|nr:conserved hypothetical protein [Ricinus communis]